MKNVIFFVLLVSTQICFAQTKDQYSLEFHPQFGNSDLIVNEKFYKLSNADSIQFETLKFYISGIELLNDDKMIWAEENSFHLADASAQKSLSINLQIPSKAAFNKVKFNLGIDSITNVSGALGGDLDPTRGMYWTWQSGYVNFKLEGKSNLCNTRNKELQFHLGGYQYPFNALQKIILNVIANEKTVIVLDLEKLISGIDLPKQNEIMSPSKEAVLLSEKVSKCFSIKQP